MKTRVLTHVLIGSEHMESCVSTSSIHVIPYVNSRDSVDTFFRENACPEICANWFRTRKIMCFYWFISRVRKRVLKDSEHVKTRVGLIHTVNQDKLSRIQLIYCTVMVMHNIRSM